MAGPMSNIRFVHTAIRNDLKGIERDLSTLVGQPVVDSSPIAGRFAFLEGVVTAHEQAEEEFLFPAIDAKVAGTSTVYEQAHRTMDALRRQMRDALATSDATRAHGLASEMTERMDAHLDQEEQELIPLVDQHLSVQEQMALAGGMAAKTPPELADKATPWMLRLLGRDDREDYFRFALKALPPQAVQGLKAASQGVLSAEDWSDLTRRVPDLVS